MTSALSAKHFHDEEAAYAYVEARLWPNGPVCPHCGEKERISKMMGKSTRIGLYKCYACRKQLTVKIGSIFEHSHIAMHIWLQAIALMAASKKGISANQLHRTLGVSLKSAWFLAHRIREAMRSAQLTPFGSDGGAVEVDETFWGQNPEVPKSRTPIRSMNAIMTMIDRNSGQARSVVVSELTSHKIGEILADNISKEARLMTDEARHYMPVGKEYADHKSVRHAQGEFVSRVDPSVHTQTVENFYSVFKRGMRGTYQHCARRHLHRYCAEFDFRYSNRVALGVNDHDRADALLKAAPGKRLTWRTANRRGARAVAQQ